LLKAQNKTTVVTVKGDTLLKKTIKNVTSSEDPVAMAKYYKELEAWKDTVNFLIKQHQENPSAGTLNLPPSPKQPTNNMVTEQVETTTIGKPSKRTTVKRVEEKSATSTDATPAIPSTNNGNEPTSATPQSNANTPISVTKVDSTKPAAPNMPKIHTSKKKVVLNGLGDTLYVEQRDFDQYGNIINENIKIINETIDVKEISDIVKKEIEKAKAELNANNQQQVQIEIREPNYSQPNTPIHFKYSPKPEPTVHNIRLYYGLNNLYQYTGDFFTMDAMPNPAEINQMPDIKRSGSDHIAVESLWGFNLIAGKIRLYSGIRYDNYDYNFQNTSTILQESSPVFTNLTLQQTFVPDPQQIQSKLSTHYVAVPLAIGIEPRNPYNGIHIRAGINNQFLVNSYLRTRFKDKSKNKIVDDFNLNDFLFSPFVHMEYGDIGIDVNYSLNNLFKTNQAFATRLLTIGVSLNLG